MNNPRPPRPDKPADGEAGTGASVAGSKPAARPRPEPMEPDQAQEALIEIQELLRRARLVETVVHNQVMDKHELVENLVYRQNNA